MNRQPLRLLAGFMLLAGPLGCSREYPRAVLANPEPVHGRITLGDGSPLRGGVIYFHPLEANVDGQLRYEASSLIHAAGHYKLGFNGDGLGAAIGDYKVTVTPRDYQELPGSNSNRIAVTYREKESSPLAATVKPGDNIFDFALK